MHVNILAARLSYIITIYTRFQDESLPAKWPQRGNIEFRLVSLKYANQNDCIIKDLSIDIPAGQRVSASQ